MPNRREILQGGAVLGAAAVVGGVVLTDAPLEGDRGAATLHRYFRILFEEGSSPAGEFATEAQRLGGTLHRLTHDGVRDFWYRELHGRWAGDDPAPIAGLTSEEVAFELDLLGRDAGRWRVFRGEHLMAADGSVRHQFGGCEGLVAAGRLGLAGKPGWPARLAHLLGTFNPLDDRGVGQARLLRSHDLSVGQEAGERLVSWIIAPRSALTG